MKDIITIAEDPDLPKTNNQLVSYRVKFVPSTGYFENRLLTWYSTYCKIKPSQILRLIFQQRMKIYYAYAPQIQFKILSIIKPTHNYYMNSQT